MSGVKFETVCFVACPIGEPESKVRQRSDKVLKFIIKPAVESFGLTAVRADEISQSGMITSQVVNYLEHSHLVIADLTGQNPNVYYELAIRHCSGLPCKLMIEKGDAIPFDLMGQKIILLDSRDLESANDARSEIIAMLEHIGSTPGLEPNPVWMGRWAHRIAASDQPEERQIGAAVDSISSRFQQAVAALEDQIRSLKDPIVNEVSELTKGVSLLKQDLGLLKQERSRRAAALGAYIVKELVGGKGLFPRDFGVEHRISVITSILLGRLLEARERVSDVTGRGMQPALEVVEKLEKAIEEHLDHLSALA